MTETPLTTSSQVLKYLRLRQQSLTLTDLSEREDCLAEIQLLRSVSVIVSILCALDDVQTRFPLLIPLMFLFVGLRLVF